MAFVAVESAGALVELDIGGPPGTLARLVESQRELFHTQIDQLQKLVVAQCKLTGVNPLAQEMPLAIKEARAATWAGWVGLKSTVTWRNDKPNMFPEGPLKS
ncbi:hypothetical protein MUK42_02586 [Musa troglodytarum]|uniref:Uncharacterized protein n=1 Tax=Musa troglodytarum TaxID=320322 RepID=A0A9E7JK01_9LILI|nr:hypothetical protein MUK42_02586 [Musa troglodytarum]